MFNINNKAQYERKLRSKLIFFIFLVSVAILYQCSCEKNNSKEQLSKPIPITFDSEGSKLCGYFFPANTNKPVPTVILCQGGPGNDKEPLGLGTKMMEKGINALAFNYRGSWASEGYYTPENAANDVKSAVSYVSSPNIVNKFSVDTTNLFLVGYSFGSNMALIGSLDIPQINNIVSITTYDLSVAARAMKKDEKFRIILQTWLNSWMSDSTIIRGAGAKAFVDELLSTMAAPFDLVKHAEELSHKDILLIGCWQDRDAPFEEYILPFYRSLQKHGAKNLEIEMFNDSHSFEDEKEKGRLVSTIISWIKKKTLK